MSDPMPYPDVPPPNKPMSVKLARALAEAADGFRGHKAPVFLVAPYKLHKSPERGGFHIFGPYHDWEHVPRDVKRLVMHETHGFFGPFDTGGTVIVHGRPIGSVTLHVRHSTKVFHLRPDRIDTLFFSAESVEKFALPYYERVYGPAFAARVRDQFATADTQFMAHYPWTEYTDGSALLAVAPMFGAMKNGRPMLRSVDGEDWVDASAEDAAAED